MRLSQLLRLAKKRLPKPLHGKGGTIRWLCCAKPFKQRSPTGGDNRVATCVWKKGNRTGCMPRVVGRPAKDPDKPDSEPVLGPAPTQIEIGGHLVRSCGQ